MPRMGFTKIRKAISTAGATAICWFPLVLRKDMITICTPVVEERIDRDGMVINATCLPLQHVDGACSEAVVSYFLDELIRI